MASKENKPKEGTSKALVPVERKPQQGTSKALVPVERKPKEGTSKALVPVERKPKEGASKETKEKKKRRKPRIPVRQLQKPRVFVPPPEPPPPVPPRDVRGKISSLSLVKQKPKPVKDKSETDKPETDKTAKDKPEAEKTEKKEIGERQKNKLIKKGKRLKIDDDDESETDLKSKKQLKKKFVLIKPKVQCKDKDKDKDKDKEKDKDKDTDKEKDKAKVSKDKLKVCASKRRLSSKRKEVQKDLRDETVEEKGHNQNLLDSVFHNMELKRDEKDKTTIKKEQEPVQPMKYNRYEDVVKRVAEQVKEVLENFAQIFQLYKPNEIMLSFNGGKDCTAVLHMLHTFFKSNAILKHLKIPTLYITDPDAFEEVDEFVKDCEKIFNIELIRKKGPIKKALVEICKERPEIKAVFMGCRRTDPYCKNLKMMQPTDLGWPPLMRIMPIIEWTCRDVWQYMYMYNVPYCILYQKGYTSIGNKKDTIPNPYLGVRDSCTGRIVDYRPGHELLDNDELERAGRKDLPKVPETEDKEEDEKVEKEEPKRKNYGVD